MTSFLYDAARAKIYNQTRHWTNSPVPKRIAEIITLTNDLHVLEIACGTGHMGEALHQICDTRFMGLDCSQDMLKQAALKQIYKQLVQGDATRLPFSHETFDRIIGSFFLHHIPKSSRPAMVQESYRILRQGTAIFVTSDPDDIVHHPLYRFFPDIAAIDFERLPQIDDLCKWFTQAGFAKVHVERVSEMPTLMNDAYANRIECKPFSTLELIPSDRFDMGMKKLREHIQATQNQPETHARVNTLVFGLKH